MKKQTKQTKLSLDKFKIAKISNFEKGNIFGGETNANDDGTNHDETTTGTRDQAVNNSGFDRDKNSHCRNKLNN